MKQVKLIKNGNEFYMSLNEFNEMILDWQKKGYPNDKFGDIKFVEEIK
ncbi:MAG: hypothetical protein LBF97_02830 [Elusimicrobiota bacterium]|jgi:hypothetical protein|nr:hypothetical protein [Elusimicrobiota bacterium]